MHRNRKSIYLQEYRGKGFFTGNRSKTFGAESRQPAVISGEKDIPPFLPE